MCQFLSPETNKPLFFSVMRCFMVFLRLNEPKSVQSRMEIQFRMTLPFDRLFTRRIGKILICGENMEESVGFSLVESRNMSVFFLFTVSGKCGAQKLFLLLPGDPWKHLFQSKRDGTIYLPFEMEKNEICGD